MPIVKTEAFVLKSFKYGDTSKIVTLFTREYGKMNVIVKGARNFKSKLCGTIETMNYINSVIYLKEYRELQFLSTAEYKKSFKNIISDFSKLQAAFKIIEILNKSVADREINISLFELTISTYQSLDESSQNSLMHLLNFQIELVKILGLSPYLFNNNFNSIEKETFFDFNELSLNKYQYSILKSINENLHDVEKINEMDKIDNDVLSNLTSVYEKYILEHTQGNKFYKTAKVFQELNL